MSPFMPTFQGFFVPLYQFTLHPTNMEEKMANMTFAFKLVDEAGLPRPRWETHVHMVRRNRPSEIVHGDLKATLRLIYSLFIKYKVT